MPSAFLELLRVVPTGDSLHEPLAWRRWLKGAFAATPDRFRHSVGVHHRAAELAQSASAWLDPERARTLELACLLHDVGRALDPGDHEPHGFVGARFLDTVGLVEVAPLVAHHSGSRFEAAARNMAHLDWWPHRDRDLLAVLTFFDRTISSNGRRVTIAERRAELMRRCKPGSNRVISFEMAAADAERGRRLVGDAPVLRGIPGVTDARPRRLGLAERGERAC